MYTTAGNVPSIKAPPPTKDMNTLSFVVEADEVEQDAHVVQNRIHAGELTEEDHDIGVHDRASRSGVGDEVHPGISLGLFLFLVLRDDGPFYSEELLWGFKGVEFANLLPGRVGFELSDSCLTSCIAHRKAFFSIS
jgi:hypothetical protein